MKLKITLIILIIFSLFISGCVDKQTYKGLNINTKNCYDELNSKYDLLIHQQYDNYINICNNIEIMESYKFI